MLDKMFSDRLCLAAVDMDGTVLNSRGMVAEETLQALRIWKERGGLVIPASGRTYGWIPREILELGVPYVITGNGASVIDTTTGSYIYESKIEFESGLDLIRYLLTEHGQCYVQLNDRYYEDGNKTEEMERIHPYMALLDLPRDGNPGDLLAFLINQREDIQKIGFLAFDEETECRIMENSKKFDRFKTLRTGALCLEFNRRGTNKGAALKFLCGILNLEPDQVMAIGDSENDLDMLTYAGVGVAMGNAAEEVKKAADFVTRTNDENGVACVFQKIL